MEESPIKPNVLDYDDIRKMVPFFEGKPKLVNFLLKLLKVDKINGKPTAFYIIIKKQRLLHSSLC